MDIPVIIAKLVISVTFIVGLSVIAERAGPRIAGILSGYPGGVAINLFFFGIENGAGFAAESAVYNMTGLAATLSCIFFYFRATGMFSRNSIPACSAFAVAGYFVVVWGLHWIPPGRVIGIVIPFLSIALFTYLFRKIENVTIVRARPLTRWVLLFRALFSASIILVITGVAHSVGPAYAGLFAAFPSTLFPLILIVHYTYGKAQVNTMIKNVPAGLGSVVLYSLTVSLCYPSLGVYLGTLASFGSATVYLGILMGMKSWVCRSGTLKHGN